MECAFSDFRIAFYWSIKVRRERESIILTHRLFEFSFRQPEQYQLPFTCVSHSCTSIVSMTCTQSFIHRCIVFVIISKLLLLLLLYKFSCWSGEWAGNFARIYSYFNERNVMHGVCVCDKLSIGMCTHTLAKWPRHSWSFFKFEF